MIDYVVAAVSAKKLSVLLAGFLGGVISLRFFDNLKLHEKLGVAVAGAVSASYITPSIVSYFALTAETHEGGVGFLIGLFGMSITSASISVIKSTDWAAIIKGRLEK